MCMPSSGGVPGLGYSWGFSTPDITKAELAAEAGLAYSLGNTISGSDATLTVSSHKSPQQHQHQQQVQQVQVQQQQQQQDKKLGRRTMFLVNDSFSPSHRSAQQNHTIQSPIQLTAEECNEILMKRALQQAAQSGTVIDASQLNHNILNGSLKSLADGIGAVGSPDSQSGSAQVQIVQTKQEPGTNGHSPKTPTGMPKERPYNCEECGKSFLLKHHLTTHSRVHTGERPHVCPHCGKAFAHKHCLNTHLLLHSTERPFQCHECKKSFTLKHHLLTHSKVHSRERPFICAECGRGFPLKRHLVTHSKFHAGERPFVCQDCGESFAQKDHLVMHSRFHGSLNPFVCSDCGAAFTRKFQLVNHGRAHGRIPHSCPICGKEFLQKRTLVAHMKLHTGDAQYACIDCGDAFKGKAEMLSHCKLMHPSTSNHSSQSHSGSSQQNSSNVSLSSQELKTQIVHVLIGPDGAISEKSGYACQECGNCFNTKEALALHVRLHTGDRTFVTDLCALTAALQPGNFLNPSQGSVLQHVASVGHNSSGGSIGHIQQHVQTTNRPKVHFCNECGKGFAARHGLQQHNRRHPDGSCTLRSHICDTCGKGFFQKNHLLLHQRQHMDIPPRNQQSELYIHKQPQQELSQQQQQQNSQQQQQQQQQITEDTSRQNETPTSHTSSNSSTINVSPQTHIQQITNRDGHVIGNQILIGGARNRQIIGNQIHIVNRDGKSLGTQISTSTANSGLIHNIKQEHLSSRESQQSNMSNQVTQQQHQPRNSEVHQLSSHQVVHSDQLNQQQQSRNQSLVTLQHKDLATTSSGHLVLRNTNRGEVSSSQQLAQLNQVHIGSGHVIKYEILPPSGVVQVQSMD